LEPWSFSTDPLDLWHSFESSTQEQILTSCAELAKAGRAPRLVGEVAKKLKTREQTVRGWPVTKLAEHLRKQNDSVLFLERVLFPAYCFGVQKELNEDWNACVAGRSEDENGALPLKILEECLARELRSHPQERVRLWVQMAHIASSEYLGHMGEVDFDRVQKLLTEPNETKAEHEQKSGEGNNEPAGEMEMVASGPDVDALIIEEYEIEEGFRQAAEDLSAAIVKLRAGTLPEARELESTAALMAPFRKLVKSVSERMIAEGIEKIPSQTVSLQVVQAAISRIQQSEMAKAEERRQAEAALDVLRQVQRLAAKNDRQYEALNEVHRSAADLQDEIQALGPGEFGEEVAGKVRILDAILHMVTNASEADSDEDESVVEQIAEVYGASFVLGLGKKAFVLEVDRSAAVKLQPDSDPANSGNVVEITAAAAEEPANAHAEEGNATEGEEAESTTKLGASEPRNQIVAEKLAFRQPVENTAEFAGQEEPLEPVAAEVKPGDRSVERAKETNPAIERSENLDATLFVRRDGETSQAFAQSLISGTTDESPEALQRAVWLALGEQKYSAAFYLASLAYTSAGGGLSNLAVRIRALVLGQAIRNPIGHIADQLKLDFSTIANTSDQDSEELALALRLTMIASALRAAVLAPDTNANSAIELGDKGLPNLGRLHWLCTQLADYANLRMPLDAAALELIDRSANYAQELKEFQAEVSDWWDRAPLLNFNYAAALKLWKLWLEPDGPIGRLIDPILRNDRSHLDELKKHVALLATDERIHSKIGSEEKRLRSLGFAGKINWNALSVFTRRVREVVGYANRWIVLQEHTLSDQLDYRRNRLLELRINLDSAQVGVKAELDQAISGAEDMRVATALQLCSHAIDNLMSLIHPSAVRNVVEPEIKYLLASDLLTVPDLPMTEDWQPELKADDLQRLLVKILADPSSYEPEKAALLLSEDRRNLEAVDRILEYLSWEGDHSQLLEILTRLEEAHLKQCEDALKRQIEDCKSEVEKGVSLGIVRDIERADYIDLVEQISNRLETIRNFTAEEEKLKSIHSAIAKSRDRQVVKVRERLKAAEISENNLSYARIRAAIQRGDVDTANEYIDLFARGADLPDEKDIPDSFRAFFPGGASEIDRFLTAESFNSLIENVKDQRSVPGVELKQVPGAQIQEAVSMLEAWATLKKSRQARIEHLRTFFERLGLTVNQISDPSTANGRAFMYLDIVPLRHRDQCPVPYFGSVSLGHYRVICIWDRPSDEDILSVVRHGRQGAPAILLYFGRLTEQKRRNIAQLSRADNLNFILIDELLVSYLCGERGSRLPVMFDCALPFTSLNPYTTTSSNVPPEMFYGRRSERDQISDPMGSCFVYGGRQLGKTALLLSIRDDFHSPAEHRVALWIDLKAYGEDIWAVLSRAFRDLTDAQIPIGDARTEQKLIEKLQIWLQADNRRRILLLLDEADRFLESDAADGFHRTTSLKGLMERTNRRFKVVFAGLHNVQRTTKQKNHPLAHFGEPICVGPLLDRGEWREAKALIEKPFRSLGFRFESQDLVTRILSRTNYYPSLIQIYCSQIYRSVKLDSACLRNGPPYLITAKHVENAYISPQFGIEIRDKFNLTLNLDPRYRVLAFIIALNSLQGAASSMKVNEIREWAVTFWQAGFSRSRLEEDFRVLLEEMQGLGILREVDNGFALRTPNLLSLLGRQEEIEEKLELSSKEAPPPRYDARFHRRRDHKQDWRRNPLSDHQESELRGERDSVTIIYGTRASGLDDVEDFLSEAFGSTYFRSSNLTNSDRHSFRSYLDGLRSTIQNGTTLVLDKQSPWTAAWIEEALAAAKGKTRFMSIVFLADPEAAWRLLQDRSVVDRLASNRKFNVTSLEPWDSSMLSEWLGDCSIGSNAEDEQQVIGNCTGRWPLILQEFRTAIVSGGKPWKAALEEISGRLKDPSERDRYLAEFGLNVSVPHNVLSMMASLDCPVSVKSLGAFLEAMPEQDIEDVFHWADLLGLIHPVPDGEWQLDGIVKNVLVNGA